MRVALCYYGKLGGYKWKDEVGGIIHPRVGFESIKRHVIDFNKNDEIDIFVHSWSKDHESSIVETLNPIDFTINEQQNFGGQSAAYKEPIIGLRGLRERASKFFRGLVSRNYRDEVDSIRKLQAERAFSRWYSTKEVIKLKRKFERENGFTYDLVMLLRFDMELLVDVDFSKLNPDMFYVSKWDCGKDIWGKQKFFSNNDFQDYWFLSGSQNIDVMEGLYEERANYSLCPHRSSYQHISKNIGIKNVRYVMMLNEDYELIRRVRGTEANTMVEKV